ncbi:hypothetical protein Q5752_004954 [Cryptotrichosporon argae]
MPTDDGKPDDVVDVPLDDDAPSSFAHAPVPDAAAAARDASEHGPDTLNDGAAGHAGQPTTSLRLEGVHEAARSSIEVDAGADAVVPLALDLGPHPADALHAPDSPTTSLISSLRTQLSLLSEQSHQLNTKLVASISRHADLEDQLYALQAEHAARARTVAELERAKSQWEESMHTGLFVERSQIRDEMQRLAAGLVEEERRRGSAEEKRAQVESEVDELAATLFDQANTMVATERMSRAQAEERLRETVANLAAAEAAMRDMQAHLQSLSASAPSASSPSKAGAAGPSRRVLAHVPYTEFLVFVQHLRALRPLRERSKETFPPPQLSALLAQPFLARIVAEDHEPTLRLDAAPDLNWLSRRAVGNAVVAGDLVIEPVPAHTVIAAASAAVVAIGCTLCGKPVFPAPAPADHAHASANYFGPPPQHPLLPSRQSSAGGRFSLKPFFQTSPGPAVVATSPSASPLSSPGPGPASASTPHPQPPVYVFRVAGGADKDGAGAKAYPLCRDGWCLDRLRATCALWHFVRTGLVHVVWHSDDGWGPGPGLALAPAASIATPSDAQARRSTSTSSARGAVTPEPAPPAAPTASAPSGRKSGWGLGFKLDRSSSAGGWTRAFRSSGSGSGSGQGTPPLSPGLPPDAAAVDGAGHSTPLAPARADAVDTPTPAGRGDGPGLGAPLELGAVRVPSIKETGASPEVEPRAHAVSLDVELDVEHARAAPDEHASPDEPHVADADAIALRPDSPASVAPSSEAFATPKGSAADMSPEIADSPGAGGARAGDAEADARGGDDDEGKEGEGEKDEGDVPADDDEAGAALDGAHADADETADALDRILDLAGAATTPTRPCAGDGIVDAGAAEPPVTDANVNTDATPSEADASKAPADDDSADVNTSTTQPAETPTSTPRRARPAPTSPAAPEPPTAPATPVRLNAPPLPPRSEARKRLSAVDPAESARAPVMAETAETAGTAGATPTESAGPEGPVPAGSAPMHGEAEAGRASAADTATEDAGAASMPAPEPHTVDLTEPLPPAASATAPATASAPATATAKGEEQAKGAEQDKADKAKAKAAPPPLPPRHLAPVTPTTQISGAEAGATASEGAGAGGVREVDDAWEGRTWRAIVGLKEAMWRARVGVVEV